MRDDTEALFLRIILVICLFFATLTGAAYLAGQRSGLVEGRKQMTAEYVKMTGVSHEAPLQNNRSHKEQQWM